MEQQDRGVRLVDAALADGGGDLVHQAGAAPPAVDPPDTPRRVGQASTPAGARAGQDRFAWREGAQSSWIADKTLPAGSVNHAIE